MITFLHQEWSTHATTADSLTDLKPIHESLPVELGPSNTAIPRMIIFPSVIGKQGELVSNFPPGLCRRHRLEIITKLLFKADCWGLSSVEIHKNEPLRRDVSMDLKERMSLGLEVGKFVVLPRFVQFAGGQIRPPNQSVRQSCAIVSGSGLPAMESTCKHRTRPAGLLYHWVPAVPTNVMEGIDSSFLVPYEEEIPSKHLPTAQLSQHSIMDSERLTSIVK